jgi:hypothetical protein
MPFRGYNDAFLNTSYGTSAEDAVRWRVERHTRFLLTCSSARRQHRLLDVVLWPYNYKESEVDRARANLNREPQGEAVVRILDSRIDAATNRIAWIRFAVEIRWPE